MTYCQRGHRRGQKTACRSGSEVRRQQSAVNRQQSEARSCARVDHLRSSPVASDAVLVAARAIAQCEALFTISRQNLLEGAWWTAASPTFGGLGDSPKGRISPAY